MIFLITIIGNAQFVQKVTFEPLMDSNKTIMEIGNVTKAATFKSFIHQGCKNTRLLFFAKALFNYFHETNIDQ